MPGNPLRAVQGTLLAFFSTLMGIGGGTFGVPLMSLYSLPIHRAVATASGFGILISVPSLIGFLLLDVPDAPPFSIGAVNLPAFAVIIPMTLLTTPYGVKSGPCDGPQAAETRLCDFHHAGRGEHAAQGVWLVRPCDDRARGLARL